ncbi:MAG: HAD family hydrolase [Ardenticatenia bacterium]|nr:HAD family hydrolase [Ardenticatenia bacterium]
MDRVRAILFDLDGTLMALHGGERGGALAERLVAMIPLLPEKEVRRLVCRFFVLSETPTNYVLAVLDRVGLDTWLRPLADRARRLKGIGTLETLAPVAGVDIVVPRLARQYALGVLTNRARRETFAFLERYRLRPFFGAVTTRQDTWRFKPHPHAVRRTAALLGVRPEEALVVGDMPVDMLAARRAGAQAVGVLTGFATDEELRAAGAHAVVPDVNSLPDMLGVP